MLFEFVPHFFLLASTYPRVLYYFLKKKTPICGGFADHSSLEFLLCSDELSSACTIEVYDSLWLDVPNTIVALKIGCLGDVDFTLFALSL